MFFLGTYLTIFGLLGSVRLGSTFSPQPLPTDTTTSRTPPSSRRLLHSCGPNPTISSGSSRTSHSTNGCLNAIPRGGGGPGEIKAAASRTKTTDLDATAASTPIFDKTTKCPVTGPATILASLWGTGGVLYILGKALKRVLAIALEPFQEGAVPLSQLQLGLYLISIIWFAYVEGYKGFQLKFSPLVVKRSFTLIPGKNGTTWYHFLLAPWYSMGLMHATRKRKTISWSVSIGVAIIIATVKRLPYPWRNILNAGAVAGLSWGSLSMVLFYVQSWLTGKPPSQIDAALPETKSATKKD